MHVAFYSLLRRRASDTGTIYLSNASYSNSDTGGSTCSLTFKSDNSMTLIALDPSEPVDPYWLSGGISSNYEIRVTPTSGAFSSGSASTGTWLSLSSDRTWLVLKSGTGSKSCTATYEIRDAGTLVVLDTASISLTATGTP